MQRPAQRPHLTTGNKLMGLGCLRGPAPRIPWSTGGGYLCGWSGGDGEPRRSTLHRNGEIHQFRLALADTDAL